MFGRLMAFTTRKKRKRQLLLDCRQKYRTLVLELFPYELATSLLQHNNNQKARGQDSIIVYWFRYLRDYLTLFSLDSFATNVKSYRACYALSCYRAFYDVIGLCSVLFIIIISHRVWWISSYLSFFKIDSHRDFFFIALGPFFYRTCWRVQSARWV